MTPVNTKLEYIVPTKKFIESAASFTYSLEKAELYKKLTIF